MTLPKLSLEEAVARVSRLFVSNDGPDLNHVLQLLGTALGVSRALIFIFRENGQWLDITHAWPALSDPLQVSQPQNLDAARFPWGMAQLHQQNALVIPDTKNLPAEASAEYKLLQAYGVASLLAVPIASLQGAEPLGFLSFVETRHRHDWLDKEAGLLQVVADLVANYIARKRAEEGIGHAVRRYRALFETAPVMYVVTCSREKGPQVINCNQAFLQAMGYSRVEVLGRQLAAFYTPESRARLLAGTNQPIGEDYLDIQECQLLTSTGQVIETLLQASAELDINGQVFGIRAMYIDITERKRAEAEITRLYQQAQQEISERKLIEAALEAERASLAQRVAERTAELSAANVELAQAARLKDEFLASMSHELRTPLNAILGLSEGLQEQVYGPLNDKQLKYLQTIEESGRHLLALINDILDLSKIGAGKLTLTIEPVSILQVCQASLRLVNQNAQAKHLQVQFESDLDPATLFKADERRLKQILVNLLSNAIKFTPAEGSIGLKVQGDNTQQMVLFTVWDTGIGIAPEALSRLFKPFVQLDSSLARRYEGTGLGLSLLARLTEMHGGHVTVQSEPGQGSQFTVSLPWLTIGALHGK